MEDQIEAQNMPAHQQLNNFSSDDDHDQNSECESSINSRSFFEEEHRSRGSLFGNKLIKLDEDNPSFRLIKGKFMSKVGDLGGNVTVVGIHKKNWSGFRAGQARLRCFEVCRDVMGDNAVRFGWYGGSKDDIVNIISHGFGHREVVAQFNNLYGDAICLSSTNCLMQSVQNCVADDDGLRHVLLCRVLVGNSELVEYGSRQYHPSWEEYDCGVDDEVSPTKYIIWSTKMNTHILPEYVVSFKAPMCLMGLSPRPGSLFNKKPNSPWMPIPTLISKLSKFVTPKIINLIKKHNKDFKNGKISRREFIGCVRELVEDEILIAIIKSFQTN